MPIKYIGGTVKGLKINGKVIESGKVNGRYVYRKGNIITSAILTIRMYSSNEDTIIDWGDGSNVDLIHGDFLPWEYSFSRTYYENAVYHVRIYIGGVLTHEFDHIIDTIGQYE